MCKNKCTGATSSKGNKGDSGTNGQDGLFGGYSSMWKFDSGTSNNPAATELRLNNSADPSSATAIYVHKTNADSITLSAFLASFSNSGSYGWVRLFKEYDSSIFQYYVVTGVSLSGNVTTLAVTFVDGNDAFSDGDDVVLSFTPKGTAGTNGTNGTNAFKFVKQFVTDDIEQGLEITEVELTSCAEVPAGCMDEGTTANPFIDWHIQVWHLATGDGLPGVWCQLGLRVAGNFGYDLLVNYTTGLITVTTGNTIGTYRVVILG